MTLTHKLLAVLASLIVVFCVAYVLATSHYADASNATTLPAGTINATSSNPTVNSTASLVFATTTQCSSRIVSTAASGIMLTFSDNQGKRPTGVYGHWQGASTTVAYDAGLYGCGAVYIYSGTSQAISVTEMK